MNTFVALHHHHHLCFRRFAQKSNLGADLTDYRVMFFATVKTVFQFFVQHRSRKSMELWLYGTNSTH